MPDTRDTGDEIQKILDDSWEWLSLDNPPLKSETELPDVNLPPELPEDSKPNEKDRVKDTAPDIAQALPEDAENPAVSEEPVTEREEVQPGEPTDSNTAKKRTISKSKSKSRKSKATSKKQNTDANTDATDKVPETDAAKAGKGKKKKKPKWIRELTSLIVKLGVIAIAAIIVWNYVGQFAIVHDNNMYPHIKDGDLVIAYSIKASQKNDAVLYERGNKKIVGRIVARAGDVIEINENGMFTVNGMIPYENIFYDTKPYADGIEYPYTVPNGEVFILNDMRELTSDSRMFGGVSENDIIGSVVFVVRHRGF